MSTPLPDPRLYPDLEQQRKELLDAGWTPKRAVFWQSPSGRLFLGPHGAWKVMKGLSPGLEYTQLTVMSRP